MLVRPAPAGARVAFCAGTSALVVRAGVLMGATVGGGALEVPPNSELYMMKMHTRATAPSAPAAMVFLRFSAPVFTVHLWHVQARPRAAQKPLSHSARAGRSSGGCADSPLRFAGRRG